MSYLVICQTPVFIWASSGSLNNHTLINREFPYRHSFCSKYKIDWHKNKQKTLPPLRRVIVNILFGSFLKIKIQSVTFRWVFNVFHMEALETFEGNVFNEPGCKILKLVCLPTLWIICIWKVTSNDSEKQIWTHFFFNSILG